MFKLFFIIPLIFLSLLAEPQYSQAGQVLAYTHLLPSPFTLPAGRFVIGTQSAMGLTDFFQVGTDVIRDFYKMYNANAKLSLMSFDRFAMALTGGYEYFNFKDIDSANPDLTVTSYLPGAVMSIEIVDDLAWAIGGNLVITNQSLKSNAIETSGYTRGARGETDLSWAYNPQRKKLGNVLSAGLSYDWTYDLVGYGMSHHWPGLQVGVHYYPAATKYKLQPILAGGAVIDF